MPDDQPNTTLRIVSVQPIGGEQIEVEGNRWTVFYRYGPENWGVLMGESEEPVFNAADLTELEAAYQKWRADHGR